MILATTNPHNDWELSFLALSFPFHDPLGMDLRDVLATNLRRIRHERGLTQEDLAGLTGLSLRYIGSIERGRVSASVTVLGKLAAALEVDPSKLIIS